MQKITSVGKEHGQTGATMGRWDSDAATVAGIILSVFENINRTTIWSSKPISGHVAGRIQSRIAMTYLYSHVSSSQQPRGGSIWTLTDKPMDKQNEIYAQTAILLNLKQTGNPVLWYNLDELKDVLSGVEIQWLFKSSDLRCAKQSDSQKQEVEWWRPGNVGFHTHEMTGLLTALRCAKHYWSAYSKWLQWSEMVRMASTQLAQMKL